jgi:hypothetical protein
VYTGANRLLAYGAVPVRARRQISSTGTAILLQQVIQLFTLGDGQPLPLQSVAPALVCFQLPWEVTPRLCVPLQVPFVGLAPGLAGYYQVSVHLPNQIPSLNGEAFIECQVAQSFSGAGGNIPVEQP